MASERRANSAYSIFPVWRAGPLDRIQKTKKIGNQMTIKLNKNNHQTEKPKKRKTARPPSCLKPRQPTVCVNRNFFLQVCPETGRKFPVADGIPNMLLNEDEVWFCWPALIFWEIPVSHTTFVSSLSTCHLKHHVEFAFFCTFCVFLKFVKAFLLYKFTLCNLVLINVVKFNFAL